MFQNNNILLRRRWWTVDGMECYEENETAAGRLVLGSVAKEGEIYLRGGSAN